MDDPITLLPAGDPPAFPQCAVCPYKLMGPAWICVQCASKTLEAIAERACPVCSQRLEGDQPCRNRLCHDPQRRIERIDAVAYLSGALHEKIISYKYDGKSGWALIFGRLLVGWLEAHARDDPPDLVVANPTHIPAGQSNLGHIEGILHSAAIADFDRRWRFDTAQPAAIIKARATEKSAGRSLAEKLAAARALRQVLAIPDPLRVQGSDILIFDDVGTTCYQLDAVADCLLSEGRAARVRGLVLARASWW